MYSLIKSMPSYYKNSKVVSNINNATQIELDTVLKHIETASNQRFVQTADITLDRWEKEYGIPPKNNYDIEFRRTKIVSKIRGSGTVSVALIKSVSESFANGKVEVIEQNQDYLFKIKFVGIIGIPANLDDLKASIEEIKPAHLAYTFEFTFNTYDVLAQYSYDYLSQFTYDELREKDLTKGVK